LPYAKVGLYPRLFHGFDFGAKMGRIGSMNMLLHPIEDPDIR